MTDCRWHTVFYILSLSRSLSQFLLSNSQLFVPLGLTAHHCIRE